MKRNTRKFGLALTWLTLLALLSVGVLASPVAMPVLADLDLSNLTWSVQSLVDESEKVFGQCQNVNPRSVRGLALSHDDNYLYLSYLQNPDYAGRVRKIDLSVADFEDQVVNELQLTIAPAGDSAKALAVDDQGRVYMARAKVIQIWDANLGLGGSGVAGTEGTSGVAPLYSITGLTNVNGVAVTRESGTLVVYASDRTNVTLQRFELTESGANITGHTQTGLGGSGILTVGGASSLRGLEIAPDGTIWIADNYANTVFRFNPDGTSPTPGSVAVTKAFDVAFDGGTALVSTGSGTVVALNVSAMSLVTTLTPPFGALGLDTGKTGLTGIDAIPDVAFYVANEDGQRINQPIEGCADDNDDNAPVLKAEVPDNQGPITSNVVADPNPAPVNAAIGLTATVDDSTTGGSNIATAEYSLDGGGWQPMVAQDDSFDAVGEDVEATFSAPADAGIYDLCVRGTDEPGNDGDPECIMFVVYDPSGGFVTGGGWIMSPEGAYTADSTLTGKANFGFVSKYKKGASVPEGNTEFQFKAGNLNFHSTTYDWLVVNQGGTRAQFKGSGTINGMGDYRFMLWAVDGAPDTFRIKIWEEDDGETVIYDNQPGDGFGQPIGGGNIVVHKSKK